MNTTTILKQIRQDECQQHQRLLKLRLVWCVWELNLICFDDPKRTDLAWNESLLEILLPFSPSDILFGAKYFRNKNFLRKWKYFLSSFWKKRRIVLAQKAFEESINFYCHFEDVLLRLENYFFRATFNVFITLLVLIDYPANDPNRSVIFETKRMKFNHFEALSKG